MDKSLYHDSGYFTILPIQFQNGEDYLVVYFYVREIENGEWRMENGEWKMGN